MTKQITLTLDYSWVVGQRTVHSELPISRCIQVLKEKYSLKKMPSDIKLTTCVVFIETTENSDKLQAEITQTLVAELGITDKSIVCVAVAEIAEEASGKAETAKPAEATEQTEKTDGTGGTTETSDPVEEERKVNDVLKVIDSFYGAEDFKQLAHEIVALAPQIKEHNSEDSFVFQNYLFSINLGFGLDEALTSFANLIDGLKLFDCPIGDRGITKISFKNDDKNDLYSYPLSTVKNLGDRCKRIICFDLTTQVNKLNSPDFKDFVFELSKCKTNKIYIFTVPFLETDALHNVFLALNDGLYMRKVVFPPLDMEELLAYSVDKMQALGYTMSEAAWSVFRSRIIEEKRDGRFYGFSTLDKLIHESIYKKHLYNASACVSNTFIEKNEISELATTSESNNLTGEQELEKLIGMQGVKDTLHSIVDQIVYAKANSKLGVPALHMQFVGGPGTGKTTVARILGKMLKERGVLRIGEFIERSGRDLCGAYIGHTAPITSAICRDAYGSVLFIDEAYTLYTDMSSDRDFGKEALATLIAEMENHRSDFVVILAGYVDDMQILMKGNAGLESRIPFKITFNPYTREELFLIFQSMVSSYFRVADDLLSVAKEYFDSLTDEYIGAKEFSNARFVRNLYTRTWNKTASRAQMERLSDDKILITSDDFRRAIADPEFYVLSDSKRGVIGFV